MAGIKNSTRRSTLKQHPPQAAQPSQRRKAKPRPSEKLIHRKPYHGKWVELPGMKGRTVEKIEFYSSGGYHTIGVNFQDKTMLSFDINPAFTVKALFENWETGDPRLLRRWPQIRSAP